MIRLALYFGMGALAHWLWIGATVDPSDIFTWICFLLGPFMVLAWLIMKAAWWTLVGVMLCGAVFACAFFYGFIESWYRTRKRRAVLTEAKRKGNML